MLSLKNLLTAALLIFAVSIVGKVEAGIVTDKMPLQCYVDHKVTSYDLNSGQAVGWIDAEVDLVQIEEIGGNGVARGTHPGRNGTVRRLFWARDVFADTNYANRPAHVNGYHEVYRTSSSGSTIGSVRDEDVTVVADNGNRAQIVYRLDNGTGYKMGWVPSSVVPPTPGPTPSNFQMESYNLTCPADHQLRFTGRLWNANNYSEITGVHVYIGGGVGAGGDFIGEFRADRDNHSFDSIINVPQNRNGNQLVVIYAVNGIDAKELDRRNINVSPSPTPDGLLYPLKGRSITVSSSITTNGINCDYSTGGSIPVYAPTNGKVEFRQSYATRYNKLASYGNNIRFYSADGKYQIRLCHLSQFVGCRNSLAFTESLDYPCGESNSSYGPFDTKIIDTIDVHAEDLIGYSGMTGNASGHHIHIEVYVKQNGKWKPVSPKAVFKTW